MREAIANEQILLQMMFKKNEKILQLMAEQEMLLGLKEVHLEQIKELKDKLPDLDRDI